MKVILQGGNRSTVLDAIIKDFENQGENNPEKTAITVKGIIYRLKMYSSEELEQMKACFYAGTSGKYEFWNEYHKDNYNI